MCIYISWLMLLMFVNELEMAFKAEGEESVFIFRN